MSPSLPIDYLLIIATVIEPIEHPQTIPWVLPISGADLQRLSDGFEAQCMEDKWDIIAKPVPGDATRDSFTLTFARNWTGIVHYILTIARGGGESPAITALTWKKYIANRITVPVEFAKQDVITLARCILDCDFEGLPDYTDDTDEE